MYDEDSTLPVELDVLQPESCDGCGLCCEGIGSPVLLYVTRDEEPSPHPFRPPGLPDELQREIDAAFGGLYRGQEPLDRCLWFDPATRRCRHYEWRPRICHDYELADRPCLALRREHLALETNAQLPAPKDSETA
jgi:uncharacterized protein